MKFFKINILFIILIVLFGINNLFAKNEKVSSYIIKFKNPTETTISYLKQSVSIKQIFNGIQNIKVNSNSLLSAKQKNDFNELNKYFLLNLPSNSNQDSIVAELKNNPDVALLEPNYVYRIDQPSTKPNDPLYPTQWALQNIFAERAWQKATGKNVIVGVIDTGIDFDHEDLKNQLWINSGEDINHNGKFDPWPSTEIRNGVSGDLNGMDDDGNGYIDDVIGYDFVDQTITNIGDYSNPDPIPTDEHGHGTNVSGVIAAQRDNSKGIVGLAYNSRIMTLRAFDATGDGESDDIARAIVYAALNGARVLNFSFGEVWASTIVHDAVKFAYSLNCVMPASSGNDNWYYPHYPSDYPECISVGASTVKNERASFSNYGSDLSLVAPGQDIEVTSPGNNYRTNNGTSFSAPYVSAASALLLELDSTLTPKDINGILQASSTGGNGWDIYMGAGILNAGEAVNTIGKTNISIISPSNNQVFNRTNITQLNIIGKVITPLFQSYQLFLGKGINPTEWDSLSSEQFEQIISDTIAKINISVLQDTSYTIRLLVKLKNNNTIENRVNIEIVSGNQPLKFSNLQQFSVFFNDRRATLVTAVTNLNSQLSVKFRRKYSSDQYVELSETDRYSNEHSILIQYEAMPDIPMEAIATAKTSEGLTFSADFEFTRSSEAFPENNFIIKNYTLPMAYLLNNVSDLYKNGKQTVELNDLTNGKWGPIKVYQFDNGNFVLKDSLTESWLPMDTGDSNGDGIPELLASKFGNTILFQSKTAGGSPFSSILFSDTVSNNLTAAKLYDLDNDNKPELIAFSDTSFIAFKYLNGKYSFIGEAKPPIQNMTIGTYPGYALGDFDGDGKPELCFSNNFGNIFIFEYSNNKFNLEYLDTTIVSNSEQYICTADVDGDGKPEILIANFGSIIPYGNDGAGEPLWNIKVLKSTGINQYKVMWQDYIYGVRGGTFYQNGVSAGNVDNQPGDEIIIAAFPNTYILKWNNSKSQMEPLWFYPYTYSNSAIVHDFDKNGINEVGISTFSGTNFYEYNGSPNKPDIPVAFDGWALNDSSAYLTWNTVPNAEKYELFEFISDNSADLIAITSTNSATISQLKSASTYRFAVRSFNQTLSDTVSDISNIIEVYIHNPIYPINVVQKDTKILLVSFSGKLPLKQIEPTNFSLLDSNKNLLLNPSSALFSNNTLVLLNFDSALPTGNKFLSVSSFPDYYRTPSEERLLNLVIQNEPQPPAELYLTRLNVISNRLISLEYSEPVEKTSSELISNYLLQPYGRIFSINQDIDTLSKVIINLDPTQPIASRGKNYTLTVMDVVAQSGHQMTTGPGNTLGFVLSASDGENAYVYPNPIRLKEKQDIYFANLPAKADVIIMDLSGGVINVVQERDGNGGVQWNGLDILGNQPDPGVYLFKVKIYNSDGSTSESSLRKFMIMP